MALDLTKPADGSALVAAEMRSNFVGLPRRLYTDYTARQSSLGALTDLSNYTVPGGTLDVDGRVLRVTAAGYFAANANNKSLNLVFGATTATLVGASGYNGVRWRVEAEIVRKGATSQIISVLTAYGGSNPTPGGTGARPTPAETLSGSVAVKIQGQGVSTGDVVQELMIVEVL